MSFAEEEVQEAKNTSEEVVEDVAEDSEDKEKEEEKEPTIAEFIEDGEFEIIEGMLDIYYETEEDTYYTIIEEEDLSKEFIYFYSQLPKQKMVQSDSTLYHLFLTC